ncbi:MltA domain-containing protein [Aliiroseovarius sediminis]|uniref:murein transglycosylase A n=1 Tax=Aliiroseovarius sediminis TaxID=2925839 RepID=UPI001F567842|nr:MltA domain-containing protein [Aliiroseovarius sediminis]MCI2394660.1 MltA domain-containing protein [Aliiroseovarius sediminis]
MLRGLACALALLGSPVQAGLEDAEVSILSFDELEGWDQDDHQAALGVFLDTCRDLDDPQWRPICALAAEQDDGKTFFELFFRPVLIRDGNDPLFTAYYEPEIRGSRTESLRYRYPVYRTPPEVKAGHVWLSRRNIEDEEALSGRGLEIAWVEDPVELQFLQIQGSGRIRLAEGGTIRLGYGGSNGHSFMSLGNELVRQGVYEPHQVSQKVIQNWVKRNPDEGRELLLKNPSYVFFREIGKVSADKGPLGAMNRSITAHRSVAIDPKYTPLGAPVWLEKKGAEPFNRLMIAQDTGSRVKGAQRADIFWGTGARAGRLAGKIRDAGRMVVLLPIQRAFAILPEE